MIDHSKRWLVAFAALYLAMLATNHAVFVRSFGYAASAVLAVVVLVASWTGRCERVPSPGWPILLALSGWMAWSVLSWTWSVQPAYTLDQLDREIKDTALALVIFWVATTVEAHAFRVFVVTALAAFALLALVAIGLALAPGGWDPGRFHHGVGPWSTYAVLVAPLVLPLIAPPPAGFRAGRKGLVAGGFVILLVVVSARMTENRIVWPALAAVFGVAMLTAALRWPHRFRRSPWRWVTPFVAILLMLGFAFFGAAQDKADKLFPPNTTVTQTIEHDPRLALWDVTIDRIAAKPWTGYGFGRRILGRELPQTLGDPMLTHAHNLFVSQALQTGLPGLALFVALLGAVCARFVRFVRAADNEVALAGIMGLALVAGFVVKNLTDDFLFRSNAKEFLCLLAILLGHGTRLLQRAAARDRPGASPG